jgi:hypothetical protein
MAQIQVYVEEYVDVDVDIDEYLDKAKTSALEEELAKRKDSSFYKEPVRTFEQLYSAARSQMEKNKNTARLFLCDILGLTHTVSTDELLTEIKSRIV